MAGSRARGGRRRRVLCEEARAQASYGTAPCEQGDQEQAPRYGEQANVENHPQITDYIPRRRRSVVVAMAGLFGIVAACQALSVYAPTVAAWLPGVSKQTIREQLAGGIVQWTSAASLLVVAVTLRIVYSLRRHRVDDQHGRYRIWRWAAAAALLASINSVVAAHTIVASLGASLVEGTLTSTAAEWWLIPLALIGGWLAWGILVEIAESPVAATLAVAAATTYVAAGLGALGVSPAWLGPWADVLTRSLPLAGHALALGAAALFARHVVLDVQGLIDHVPHVGEATTPAPQPEPTPTLEPAASEPQSCEWVDGSEPEADEEERPRKLSKAERKRLRRQKERRRAA